MKALSERNWKRGLLDAGGYLLGSVLYALSVNIFPAPNHIAPGGVTGVSTLLNYLSVSYTHLDVYKRQSPACPASRRKSAWS